MLWNLVYNEVGYWLNVVNKALIFIHFTFIFGTTSTRLSVLTCRGSTKCYSRVQLHIVVSIRVRVVLENEAHAPNVRPTLHIVHSLLFGPIKRTQNNPLGKSTINAQIHLYENESSSTINYPLILFLCFPFLTI